MPKNRVVLTFSAVPGGPFASYAGWSETLWRNVEENPETLLLALIGAAGQPITDPLIAYRRQLLTPGWRIDGVKVYPMSGGRLSNQATFAGGSMAGLFNAGPNIAEQQPYDRLLWKMNCEGGKSRACRIGGISGAIVDPGGNYTADANFSNLFGPLFLTALIQRRYGMRFATVSQQQPIIGVVTDSLVIAGASARTPVLKFKGDVSAVMSQGKTVRISNCVSPARLNGQWTIMSTNVVNADTQCLLRAKRAVAIAGEYVQGAYAVSLVYDVVSMVSGSPVRGVSRKPGRPSGLPRGRRSKKSS